MSDYESDDSDYVEVNGTNLDTVENSANSVRSKQPRLNSEGIKVRGKDIEWIEVERFSNVEDYKKSKKKEELVNGFSRRKNKSYEYGDVENFVCRFARKVGYQGCPMKYKVTFMSTATEVSIESNNPAETHDHSKHAEEDIDTLKVFRWTKEQTDIITVGVKNCAKPNVILRNLREANAFGSHKPTKQQLYNKIANTKKIVFPSTNIVNTHDLRRRVSAHLDVPDDDVEGHVVYHSIDDENEDEEPRFTIIFSTKKNLSKLKSEFLLQTDATYRLNWLGFPVFLAGKSDYINNIFWV